jgi:hypothetical protein
MRSDQRKTRRRPREAEKTKNVQSSRYRFDAATQGIAAGGPKRSLSYRYIQIIIQRSCSSLFPFIWSIQIVFV